MPPQSEQSEAKFESWFCRSTLHRVKSNSTQLLNVHFDTLLSVLGSTHSYIYMLPPLVGNLSHYNLRNSSDIQTLSPRTVLYANSFLPSVTVEWNALDDQTQKERSVSLYV